MSEAQIRAAQYVRMSTEHQQYSTENQSDMIREYAAKRNMVIVRTFADSGKSGLNIEGREALKDLIQTVQSGKADFEAILVYDVSRWGRFQDADESAHYEYICRRAGIKVLYCAEQFENDGSPAATIFKAVKRGMAGEYSRELSAKTFRGQCKLIELGFRQGGMSGYGLRRMLLDQSGQSKGLLAPGEHKSIQTDRVILVPGPPNEIHVVQRIYRKFIDERPNETWIAEGLNAEGLRTEVGTPWSRATVHEVLTNEKYIGHNVYNRVSCKLKGKRVENPPELWVRRDGAFEPIVDTKDFYRVQGILLARERRYTDDELLDYLRVLRQRHGKLSGLIIEQAEEVPSPSVYQRRFGSLIRAYALIGYTPERDYRYIEINRQLRQLHPDLIAAVVDALEGVGGTVQQLENDLMLINDQFTVSIVLSRCQETKAGTRRWLIRLDEGLSPDLSIAVRMDVANRAALDYYLLPSIDVAGTVLCVREENGIYIDAYRFDSLDYFYGMAQQVSVEVAA